MDYTFNFNVIALNRVDLFKGAVVTLEVSIIAIIIGFLIGLVCANIKTHKSRILSGLVTGYVEIIRNTPFLIQLFIIYFVFPLIGIMINPLLSGIIALSVNCGAYSTEIIRAGIESISKGQTDAGYALGMKRIQVFRYITLYPAIQKMFPALTTLFIGTMLGSSVLTAISTRELTSVAYSITGHYFRHFEVFLFVSGVYLFFSIIFSIIFKIIEVKFLSLEKEKISFRELIRNISKGSLIADISKLNTDKT